MTSVHSPAAKQAPSLTRRDCGNPTDGVTSSVSEELSLGLYLFSVKCLWGFLNDCSPPLQPCELSQPPVNTVSWVLGRVTKETESNLLGIQTDATRAGSRHVNVHTQTHPGVQPGLPRTQAEQEAGFSLIWSWNMLTFHLPLTSLMVLENVNSQIKCP